MRTRIVSWALMGIVGATTHSFASDGRPGSDAMAADLVLARPLCFAATAVGSALFIVALPFAAMSKSVNRTAKTMVGKPAQATFTRPLGDFSTLEWE